MSEDNTVAVTVGKHQSYNNKMPISYLRDVTLNVPVNGTEPWYISIPALFQNEDSVWKLSELVSNVAPENTVKFEDKFNYALT